MKATYSVVSVALLLLMSVAPAFAQTNDARANRTITGLGDLEPAAPRVEWLAMLNSNEATSTTDNKPVAPKQQDSATLGSLTKEEPVAPDSQLLVH